MDDSPLMFCDDDEEVQAYEGPMWKVLIADDDPQIHEVTTFVLKNFTFEGAPLQILQAYSASEAEKVFKAHDDIALAMIDVVMETDHAGLELVEYVRDTLKNKTTRIVLRTGQPGYAPMHEVIEKYDINDYKEKTELTSAKLKVLLYSALRAYRDIQTIRSHQEGLLRVIRATSHVLGSASLREFATAVLEDILTILHINQSALYCTTIPNPDNQGRMARTLAATGSWVDYCETDSFARLPEHVQSMFRAVLASKRSTHFPGAYVVYNKSDGGHENLLLVETQHSLHEWDRELLEIFCANVAMTYENLLMAEDIQDTQRELVFLLGEAVERRCQDGGWHVKRVAMLSEKLARLCDVPENVAYMMREAAPLHDLGKISIPERILTKPAALDREEWRVMQTHTIKGFDILQRSHRQVFKLAAEIARYHHEKWDGSGYPEGLSGEAIPLSARIAALADTFDALASRSCFKEPWPVEPIREYIQANAGVHFDPRIAKVMLDNLEIFFQIRASYPDES